MDADSIGKLHGNDVDFGSIAAHLPTYSWNVFRYIADYLHLFGVLCVILTLSKNQSCKGLSIRSQVLYLLIFVSRYLDLLTHSQAAYLVFFKLFFISTSAAIVAVMYQWRQSVEMHKDTCSILAIIVGCSVLALFTRSGNSVQETLWTFSEWLEAFGMVPQYVFSYRDPHSQDLGVKGFVLSVGGYRVFYALNWMYKRLMLGKNYHDSVSWLGGAIEILFFADYVCFRFFGLRSLLRSVTLAVDDKVNEVQERVELKMLGKTEDKSGSVFSAVGGGELRKRRIVNGDEEPGEFSRVLEEDLSTV